MKHAYILIIAIVCIHIKAQATHYRGASLTYKITGVLQIEATVTTYTKISYPSNLADRDSVQISWGDGTSSIIYRINGPLDASGWPGGILTGTDIKQNIYKGTHQYSAAPDSLYYIISFKDINLTNDILNINNGNSVNIPLYVEDSVYLPADLSQIGLNSSPLFLNLPIYYAVMSDSFKFNPSTYDADGDSLYFDLTTPLQDHQSPVPAYQSLPQFCAGRGQSTDTGLKFDSFTGGMDWLNPCAIGSFNISIGVREFRCGFLIGTVQQQMQITVLQQSVTPPLLSSIHDTILNPGDSIAIYMHAVDPNGGSYMDSIAAFGGPFNALDNPPGFTQSTGNPASGLFTWRPDASFARKNAYIFTFVATDNFSAYGPSGLAPFPISDTRTMRIWIADTATENCFISAINGPEPENLDLRLFPNPADRVLYAETGMEIETIRVLDLTGRELRCINTHCIHCELPLENLSTGVYLIKVTCADRTTCAKFTKIN